MTARYLGALSALFSIVFLASCNGSSGDNGSDPFDSDTTSDTPEYSLSVTVLNQNCEALPSNSISLGTSLCIQASLAVDGDAAINEIISFESDLGTLSADSGLTNDNGIAQIRLDSSDATLGAGTISAIFDTLTTAINFELTASTIIDTPSPTLRLALTDSQGNATNLYSNAQTINVSAQLMLPSDNNGASQNVANQIVSFQVTNAELSIVDALTNEAGIASTQIFTETAQFGAGTITATLSSQDDAVIDIVTDSQNFQIFEASDTQQDIRIGYLDEGVFQNNQLGVSGFDSDEAVSISAGATLGLFVDLVDVNDAPIASNVPVTFTSNCVQQDAANLDELVTSINGRANATYEDISCASGSGNQDTLQASVFVDGSQLSVSRVISLQAESAGSISFVSASPSNIVLQGTGGQGSESVSVVTFEVTGAQGNPVAQQSVDFSLNTQAGGLSLSPLSGLTNSQGQVSTRVTAGNVPTSIRVTAQLETSGGNNIQTQSDLLTVNTGLPDQNSISITADNLNPEAFNIDGQTVSVIARLADTFNNPVPDGTAVSFTTEGGLIEPSCTTLNGSCSVSWTSSLPRAMDHRVTILATAIGHETLSDSNGNNVYDDQDGLAITDNDGSGFDLTIAQRAGFVDLSEAWRDDNENRMRDSNEVFLDFNSSGAFDGQNGVFDGPQCDASNCGDTSLHVRKALVLVTSSSSALISVSSNGTELANNSSSTPSSPVLSIARGASSVFSYTFSDSAVQPIASTSAIAIDATNGELAGSISEVMPITNTNGARTNTFTLTNSLGIDDPSIDSSISVTITSPSGVESKLTFIVTLL